MRLAIKGKTTRGESDEQRASFWPVVFLSQIIQDASARVPVDKPHTCHPWLFFLPPLCVLCVLCGSIIPSTHHDSVPQMILPLAFLHHPSFIPILFLSVK